MYEELLQTSARPFRATPDARFYFAHDSIETARTTAIRAVRRAEGPVMVLGGVGLGKSLVGELIARELRDEYDLVKLSAARLCSRRALLQNILFDLQRPFRDLSEGELRISIMDRLQPDPEYAPEGILILVDEAHTLPVKLLEELRLISNFTRKGQPRVRLVLIGGMQLEDTFASQQLESFNQRLAARCYLTPMSREQTFRYVTHQLQVAGCTTPRMITDDGLQSVYAASEGVPRLVNQVMDHALVLAMADERYPMNAHLIEEAWADLQQLPAPWQTAADMQQQSGAVGVEFGELGGDDSDFSSFDIPAISFQGDAEVQDDLGQAVPLPGDFAEQSSDLQRDAAEQSITEDEAGLISALESQARCPQQDSAWSVEDLEAIQESLSRVSTSQSETCRDASTEIPASPDSEQNFFAAFERADHMESLEDPHNGLAPEESSLDFDRLEKPDVEIIDVAKAFASGRHKSGHEYIELNQTLPMDSFFASRPTDEKLIALEDEQRQYDMMGVWENDPPLPETETVVSPQAATGVFVQQQPESESHSVAESTVAESTVAESTVGRVHCGRVAAGAR